MSKREVDPCDQQHDCITPFRPDCANDQKLSNDYYCNAADCVEIEALIKTNEKDCGKWFARSNLTPDDRLNTYIADPTSNVLGKGSKRIAKERLVRYGTMRLMPLSCLYKKLVISQGSSEQVQQRDESS